MISPKEIAENLIEGQASKVRELTLAAVAQGVSIEKILNEGLIAAMAVVGEKFEENEIFLPEALLAAKAMLGGMEVLEPLLAGAGVKPLGRIALGTVQGDIHEVGKNLVGIMLKGAGFEVIDFGVNIPPEEFVARVREEEFQMICMSALLTTSMPFMKTTIEALEAAGLRNRIKTMVGGAVVTQKYAGEISADGYAPSASFAVDKAKELLGID